MKNKINSEDQLYYQSIVNGQYLFYKDLYNKLKHDKECANRLGEKIAYYNMLIKKYSLVTPVSK